MPDSPRAPEDFASLLPKRMVAADRHAGLDAMTAFMALTRSIADDPKMQPHMKAAHLTALEGAMTTEEGYVPLPKGVSPTVMSPGFTLRRESDERKIPVIYGRRVAQAYKQDLAKKAYRDWSDLLVYLRYSAGSSAHYSIDALGIDRGLAPAVEALAFAHALLARMESVAADVARGHVYLPQRWLQDAGLDVDELDATPDAKWLKVRDAGVAQARKLLIQGAPAVKAARFADIPAAGSAAIRSEARPADGPRPTRGGADGVLAGAGTIEGRGHSGADLAANAGSRTVGAGKRWKLKLALAWVKAGLDLRCDGLAASPMFPAPPAASPTMRRALASLRALF